MFQNVCYRTAGLGNQKFIFFGEPFLLGSYSLITIIIVSLICKKFYLPCWFFLQMRIPLEHLASTVPIFSLSQVPVEDQVAPKSIKDRFFGSGVTRSGERRVSIGSAPTSPAFQRKMAMSMLVESHDELRPGNLTANQMLSSSLTSFDHTAIDNEYGKILIIFCL